MYMKRQNLVGDARHIHALPYLQQIYEYEHVQALMSLPRLEFLNVPAKVRISNGPDSSRH